jgi:hypothetical protein
VVDDAYGGRKNLNYERSRAFGRQRANVAATLRRYDVQVFKYPNMKELRVQHAGDPLRIMFIFDPRQTGILLIGGVKGGKGWTEKMVARADKIYEQYLREIKKEGLI